jgi:short subunit dehydrogenase-like uncharacterized protein
VGFVAARFIGLVGHRSSGERGSGPIRPTVALPKPRVAILHQRRDERESGFFDILFVAEMPDQKRLRLVVRGDRDPGYGSTSRMIAEAALCLARDIEGQGGIWTPGAVMSDALVRRFQANAGVSFNLEDDR